MDNHKDDIIDKAINMIEKQYGSDSLLKKKNAPNLEIEVIKTGFEELDTALGVGGIPRGKIIEIYGEDYSRKTTMSLLILREAQKQNGIGAFVDVEHALDLNYAKRAGIDITGLIYSKPETAEESFETAKILLKSGAVDVLVLDSAAALLPKEEMEKEIGNSDIYLQSEIVSQNLMELIDIVKNSKSILIIVNQIRDKIRKEYWNKGLTPGGKSLKFYSSIRLETKKVGFTTKNGKITGDRISVCITKNTMALPFRTVLLNVPLYSKE